MALGTSWFIFGLGCYCALRSRIAFSRVNLLVWLGILWAMDGDGPGWTCVLAGVRTLIKDFLVSPFVSSFVYLGTYRPIK